ncbi:MAG TPA: MFS transporter [Acidimicrobiia bacterium]|nr:MFS transporter [Acidimicrobiia bacterium]
MTDRTRLRWILFAAVGAMSTGYLAAVTVSTLAARDITGSPLLAGVPAAVGTVSTAVGTAVLGRVVVSAGRRRSLLLGMTVATLGGVVAFLGVLWGVFAVLVAGMGVIGFGNAAAHLARYSAAELVEPARRGSAVSVIVWASTIGAVAGPRLLAPGGQMATELGAVEYAGGYLATALFMGLATVLSLVALRPDPSTLAIVDEEVVAELDDVATPFRRPAVQMAVAAMVIGHFVMVLIMTATPIHVENSGFGLGTVGNIISAHTLGMFAFAPLVGRVTDRVGAVPMMWLGAGVLVAAGVVAAFAPHDSTVLLGWGLFLLGLGWNFGFVAGSKILTVAVEPELRPLIQGRVDSMVWGVGAAATIGSGILLDGPGYASTAFIGTALVGVLVWILITRRPRAAAILH